MNAIIIWLPTTRVTSHKELRVLLANKMKVFNFPGAKQLCQKVVNFTECKNEYVAQKLLGSKKNLGMNMT